MCAAGIHLRERRRDVHADALAGEWPSRRVLVDRVANFLGEVWVNEKGLAVSTSANPSSLMVAGARNHLPANRSLQFKFEVVL